MLLAMCWNVSLWLASQSWCLVNIHTSFFFSAFYFKSFRFFKNFFSFSCLNDISPNLLLAGNKISTQTGIGTSIAIAGVALYSYIKAKLEEEKRVRQILNYTGYSSWFGFIQKWNLVVNQTDQVCHFTFWLTEFMYTVCLRSRIFNFWSIKGKKKWCCKNPLVKSRIWCGHAWLHAFSKVGVLKPQCVSA